MSNTKSASLPAAPDDDHSWQPESPFIDHLDDVEGPSGPGAPAKLEATYVLESPFVSVYDTERDIETVPPKLAELYAITSDLRDAEFDDILYQLQAEVYEHLAPRLEAEEGLSESEIEGMVDDHFGPLVRETSLLLDNMAAELERHELETASEVELDRFFDRFEPIDSGLPPSFEGFLKKVFKKAKKAVKKAASAVKKGVKRVVKTAVKVASAPLALVLKKLKKLVKPLLRKVLLSAIDKLPESLQDAARQAASKLFGSQVVKKPNEGELISSIAEAEVASIAERPEDPTDAELDYMQTEFDLYIANLVLADDEAQQDIGIVDYENQTRRVGPGRKHKLRRARRRLSKKLRDLNDGDDATPAVEEFIPALLPVLRLGIKMIGRKRVVATVAGLVGRLLRPFTGPKMSAPLANAIVSTGMGLVGLEVTEEDKKDIAANSTASVVEDTVRRVVQMPAEILEDEFLLEAAVEDSFEAALMDNFPRMPQRPDLVNRELDGSWHQCRKIKGVEKCFEYKRFEPPIPVTITQTMAEKLRSFGGAEVTVLGNRIKQLVGKTVQVRLYEAVPGTWLSKISRDEVDVAGLGGTDEIKWRSIHPLTPHNAAQLLKDESMGRDVGQKFLNSPHTIAAGQRFFYIETSDIPPGPPPPARRSALYYVFDCPQRFVSITLYIREDQSQQIAKALRDRSKFSGAKVLIKLLRDIVDNALRHPAQTVDIRKEAVIEGLAPIVAVALRAAAEAVKRFGPVLIKWLLDWLYDKGTEIFTEAADHPADGVTLKLTWRNPIGLDVICRLLNSSSVSEEDLKRELIKFTKNIFANIPEPEFKAGYHRD